MNKLIKEFQSSSQMACKYSPPEVYDNILRLMRNHSFHSDEIRLCAIAQGYVSEVFHT